MYLMYYYIAAQHTAGSAWQRQPPGTNPARGTTDAAIHAWRPYAQGQDGTDGMVGGGRLAVPHPVHHRRDLGVAVLSSRPTPLYDCFVYAKYGIAIWVL